MKRLLVIAYYFPPSGGAGVQRVLKFVKYLPHFGWAPTVLTVDEGAFPRRDATLSADLSPDLAVHRTPSIDPFRLYGKLTGKPADQVVAAGSLGHDVSWKEKLARWVRANVFLPDARVGWVPYAIREGKRLLADGSFDAVLTSGPPQSVHLIGWALQRHTGIPWVADFRDPWSESNYYHEFPRTAPAQALDRWLEQSVLNAADAVTSVSPSWVQGLARVAQRTPDAFHLVENGYDEADFEDRPPGIRLDRFTIAHVGNMYASRNPVALWKALAQLRAAHAVPHLRLRLVGGHDASVASSLAAYGLTDIVETEAYLTHREAVIEMQRSALLVLSIEAFEAAAGMITGKLYEYLASGRPVLGIGPAGGDAARLLNTLSAGTLYDRHDVDGIASMILAHYAAWASGQPKAGAASERVAPYSRRTQTGKLASVLNHLED